MIHRVPILSIYFCETDRGLMSLSHLGLPYWTTVYLRQSDNSTQAALPSDSCRRTNHTSSGLSVVIISAHL